MPQRQRQFIIKQLQEHTTLCNWSKFFSMWVWDRIGFCRLVAKMNVFETSITQELICQFWELAHNSKLPIEVYQSKDEKANGSDLEIAIQTKQGYFLVPCQAKIVNKNSRYAAFSHKVNNVYQLDILLSHGRKVRGLPLYLLYNFHDTAIHMENIETLHNLTIQELGCTVQPATLLKKEYSKPLTGKLSIPNFYDLHRKLTIPFSRLICSIGTTRILEETQTPISAISFYPAEELTNRNYWRDLAPPAAIGRISPVEEPGFIESPQATSTSFNPRFRILLSIERRVRGQLFSN